MTEPEIFICVLKHLIPLKAGDNHQYGSAVRKRCFDREKGAVPRLELRTVELRNSLLKKIHPS